MTSTLRGWSSKIHLRAAANTLVALGLFLLGGVAAPTARAQTYEVLQSLTGADGANPSAPMIQDTAGNFYGTASGGGNTCSGTTGCGIVFKLDTAGNLTVLYAFTGGADGAFPYRGLILDASGNLYGVTANGGAGAGVVFKVDTSNKETVLYTFTGGADGANPTASLLLDSSGNLFGTAVNGGIGYGVVYKLDPTGHLTVLHNFTGGADGANPYGRVGRDSAGNLFGTAAKGGAGYGVVFRLDTSGNFSVLHTFDNSQGANPNGDLVQDAAGNLYGTTINGGNTSCYTSCYRYLWSWKCTKYCSTLGVAFKLDTSGNYTMLHYFTGGTSDGANPPAGLIIDAAGDVYGVTRGGGAYGHGVVFEVDTSGNETILHNFSGGSDGATPEGPLVQDRAGNLFGTTWGGGTSNLGTVFKIINGGAVGLSPTSLSFGNVGVDTTSSAQTLTLSNGTSSAASVSLSITGTNASYFSQTNTCGSTLAASSSCQISVTFTPLTAVSATATLNTGISGVTAALSGTGVATTASVSPTSLTFASQAAGTTSASQPAKLTNTGTVSMTINSMVASANFAETNNCGSSLAAGVSCTLNVIFAPTTTGTLTGMISINDSAGNSPQTINLSGTGTTSAGSVPAFVQVQNNIDTSGTAFTTFSVPITTSPGDLLVAFVRESSNGTDNFTVTDSAGQTWALTASGYKNESSSGPRIGMFYIANSAALSSVTVHYTTSGGVIKPGIMVMEFSGAAISGVADGSVNNASGASVTTSSSGSLTTTNASDILIFATDASGNESGWTAGAGYAIPNNKLMVGASGSNVRMAMQYAVVSSVQSNTATSMNYANSNWNGNIFAAFK